MGPNSSAFMLKLYNRDTFIYYPAGDTFIYYPAGENAAGASGVTFKIGPDGKPQTCCLNISIKIDKVCSTENLIVERPDKASDLDPHKTN